MEIESWRLETRTCLVCGDEFTPVRKDGSRCSKKHTRKCLQCGKEFVITANKPPSRKYCSTKCRGQSKKKARICPVCNKEFFPNSNCHKICSDECRLISRKKAFENSGKIKICPLCGKEFTSQHSTQKYCSNQHQKECVICGKMFDIEPGQKKKTCSKECKGKTINTPESNEKRKKAYLQHYGTDSPFKNEEFKKKIRESMMEKYGVESYMQSPEARIKSKETCMKKYGVDHPMKDPEIQARKQATNIERYGGPSCMSSKEVRDRAAQTIREKYGVEWINQSPEVREKYKKTCMERYGVDNVSKLPEVREKVAHTVALNPELKARFKISKKNRDLASRILSVIPDADVEFEAGFGVRYSADLKISYLGRSVLVDINPTVSHNTLIPFACRRSSCKEVPCSIHTPQDSSYQYKRACAARDSDAIFMQFFDWDDPNKVDKLILSRLIEMEKISARSLSLFRISQKEANAFFDESHFQGSGRNQDYCYALKLEDEIIAAASFGNSRYNKKKHDFEFIRYATKYGYIIYGGANRLFQYFISDVNPENVVSYVDFNHTTKQDIFLSSMGFNESSDTGKSCVWSKGNKRVLQNTLNSVGADRILGTSYGSREECGMNNKEIMIDQGWLPVYTAGNRVFEWSR